MCSSDLNWLVSTSEGFLRVDEHFQHKPILLNKEKAPKVSPMGVNVFESDGKGGWLIGSFSGMFRWNPEKNQIVDYFTGKANQEKSMIPISNHLVSGYSKDFFGGKEVVFDYSTGIILFILPYRIRRQKRLQAKEKMQKLGKQMVFNAKWHNKLGYTTIILTLWLAITGMCLRPPLMKIGRAHV